MRSFGDCACAAPPLRPRGEDNGDGVWERERDERRARPRRWRRSVAGVTSAMTEEAAVGSAAAFFLLTRLRLLVGAEQQPVGPQQPPFPSARRRMGLPPPPPPPPLLAFLSSGLAALSFDLLLRDSHRLRLDRSGPWRRSSGSCRSCRKRCSGLSSVEEADEGDGGRTEAEAEPLVEEEEGWGPLPVAPPRKRTRAGLGPGLH